MGGTNTLKLKCIQANCHLTQALHYKKTGKEQKIKLLKKSLFGF